MRDTCFRWAVQLVAGTVSLAEQQASQPVNQQVPWRAHELVWPGHAAL